MTTTFNRGGLSEGGVIGILRRVVGVTAAVRRGAIDVRLRCAATTVNVHR